MPDHWGFVVAAYTVTAVILAGYWRMLARKERELATEAGARTDNTSRSQEPSETAHPRPDPGKRAPLQ